jgi:hypothetical protein
MADHKMIYVCASDSFAEDEARIVPCERIWRCGGDAVPVIKISVNFLRSGGVFLISY